MKTLQDMTWAEMATALAKGQLDLEAVQVETQRRVDAGQPPPAEGVGAVVRGESLPVAAVLAMADVGRGRHRA